MRPAGAIDAITALLASLIVVPYLIGDGFVYHVFITICIFAALSTAWNIVGGFAGQLSLGHAIFYGIGAYAGIILMNMGISPWLGMFVGAALLSWSLLASAILVSACTDHSFRWRPSRSLKCFACLPCTSGISPVARPAR